MRARTVKCGGSTTRRGGISPITSPWRAPTSPFGHVGQAEERDDEAYEYDEDVDSVGRANGQGKNGDGKGKGKGKGDF